MRKGNKKNVLKKKDDKRNLHFPSCPPDVQAALRERDEMHRMEQVDEVQCRCYLDRRRNASTHRSRLRDLPASRVPVYGTKDAGRGLWLRLKNTCKQFKCSLNQILQTLFTLRNEQSKIIAVMSSNVDDLCMPIFRKELKP